MSDRPWYRVKPLPKGALIGEVLLASGVVEATRDFLSEFARLGAADGGHEGLVLWAGRELGALAVITTVIIPASEHGPQRVHVSREGVGEAAAKARANRVGILAQVHSHPGDDGRHSDGDDELVMMPFEGMLSIVAPHYGTRMNSVADAVVHQYQNGRWVWCDTKSVSNRITTAPLTVDAR